MPHLRQRLCETVIKQELARTPCIGVLGMRQVGKSTLVKQHCNTYYTLDSQDLYDKFNLKSSLLRLGKYPIGIDEIQKAPKAFDEIKFDIDSHQRPGKFILSGSVRFSSKKQIRESLTGRISLIEIFPMTLAECHERSGSAFLSMLFNFAPQKWEQQFMRSAWVSYNQLGHYLVHGGLPGICFKRDTSFRHSRFENHLETLLTRDVHMIYATQMSYHKARLLLTELARIQGLPVNVSNLARLIQVSQPSVKKFLLALEGLFLIRAHGLSYYLEDVGLAQYLYPNLTKFSRLSDWLQMMYHELRVQMAYLHRHQLTLETYTTRGGSVIPFVIKSRTGQVLAITLDLDGAPSMQNQKTLTWFLKKHSQATGVILTFSSEANELAKNIYSLPLKWLF